MKRVDARIVYPMPSIGYVVNARSAGQA